MQLPTLQIIPQRHSHDCSVACLAMICRISYEEALMAFRHNVCTDGASIRQIQRAAARLGRTLLWSRRVSSLENETGILCVRSQKWPCDHLVVFKEEQIVDTDATLWDADVFMSAYEAKPISFLRLEEGQ